NRGPLFGLPWSYGATGVIYQDMADSFYKAGNIVNSKEYSELAFEQFQLRYKFEKKRQLPLNDTYLQLGDYYLSLSKINSPTEKTQNLEKAKAYYRKLLLIAQQSNSRFSLLNSYNRLTSVDTLLHDYQAAINDYRMYNLYLDSIVNEENTNKILQSQMQYEYDKKEAFVKSAQIVKDAEAKRIKTQQYFTIIGLVIVILAVVIIALIQYRNNKHRQQANILLQHQKQKVETTLSDLKATQTQLIQSEKMASLGELTAGIAHEIQNPLNFVNNFSEVNAELIDEAKQEIDNGNIDEVKLILNDIKENEQKINHHGKRADAIVKGMLQHSRSGSSIKEPTDINKLADEYLRLAYQGLRAKDKSFNATLKTDFDESIGKINIIPQDIGRVILNLINNAFYAVNEKRKQQNGSYEPTVSVGTKKVSDKIFINVKDNGNGIPQKIVDKIFHPFFTTKPTGQGTGLGLSLSYDIIKAHGGEIKVETREGESTIFTIELPA
ncbi:MAG: ATP-binding protein, partial [Ferruginibacter sp.]